jgi:hypothetical protein
MPNNRDPIADFEIAVRRDNITDELHISLLKELAEQWLRQAKQNSGYISMVELTKMVLHAHQQTLAQAFETFHSVVLNGGHVNHNRDMNIEVSCSHEL